MNKLKFIYFFKKKGKAFSQLILEENSKKPIPDPSMGEIYVLLGV